MATERTIQTDIINACIACGWGVLRINTIRAKAGGNTFINSYITYPSMLVNGCNDLIVMHGGIAVFVECKSEIGKLTRAQRNFRKWVEHFGMIYLVGRSTEIIKELKIIFDVNYNVQTLPTTKPPSIKE